MFRSERLPPSSQQNVDYLDVIVSKEFFGSIFRVPRTFIEGLRFVQEPAASSSEYGTV